MLQWVMLAGKLMLKLHEFAPCLTDSVVNFCCMGVVECELSAKVFDRCGAG